MGVGLGVNDVPIVGEPVAFGIGFLVLLVVLIAGEWAGSFVTVAHEGGHMLTAALTGRGHKGFKMDNGDEAGTAIQDASWGVGDYILTFAGYATPPLLGLSAAALVATDNAWAVLWVSVVLLLLAVVFSRNTLATVVTLLAVGGVIASALWGSANLQAAVAVAIAWLLLLGGVRHTFTMSRGENSDAYWLARRTWIPTMIWQLVWILVAIVALIVGGQLLLRPGYGIG